jgi:hypothetical protein
MTIASRVLETSLQRSGFEDWINADQNLPVVNPVTDDTAASARKLVNVYAYTYLTVKMTLISRVSLRQD